MRRYAENPEHLQCRLIRPQFRVPSKVRLRPIIGSCEDEGLDRGGLDGLGYFGPSAPGLAFETWEASNLTATASAPRPCR